MTLRAPLATTRARRLARAGLGLTTVVAVVVASAGTAHGSTAYRERLSVDAGGTRQAVTDATLLAGHEYQLTVTGTYTSGATVADAECTKDGLGPTYQRERADGFDLLVAGQDVDWQPSQSDLFTCDTSTHEYSYRFTPTADSALELRLDLALWTDAHGRLDVELVGEAVAVKTATASDSESPPPPPATTTTPAPAPAPPRTTAPRPATATAPTPTAPTPAAPAAPDPAPPTPEAQVTITDTLVKAAPRRDEVQFAQPVTRKLPLASPIRAPGEEDGAAPQLMLLLLGAIVAGGAAAMFAGPGRRAAAAAGPRPRERHARSHRASSELPQRRMIVVHGAPSTRLGDPAKRCDCGYCNN